MIPVGDSPQSRTVPYVNYLVILINVAVFAWMFTLGNDMPPSRAVAQREFTAQTNGECYGYETAPTEIDRFFCDYSLQPREFMDNLRGESDVPEPNRGLILLLLDKVEATGDPKYIALLEAWEQVDYKKTKQRIRQVIQHLNPAAG